MLLGDLVPRGCSCELETLFVDSNRGNPSGYRFPILLLVIDLPFFYFWLYNIVLILIL